MGKFQIFNWRDKPFITFAYFLFLGSLTFLAMITETSLTLLMQIMAALFLMVLISAKFILFRLKQPYKTTILVFGLTPAILFIDFLIFATGGLSSQYLILTHFFAIALAFLLSPQIAVSFIAASLALVLANLAFDPSAKEYLIQNPIVSTLYFIAYVALIPFSYILAREYKIKEEWIGVLEEQIATSKVQEEELLKNIESAVFVLNPQLELISLNKAAMELAGYGKEVLGKDFFKYFSFKDKEGRPLEAYSLPFAQTLSSKTQSFLEDIHMQGKTKEFFRVDIKILPALNSKGPLGLVLIAEDKAKKEKAGATGKTTTPLALARFLMLLRSQQRNLQSLSKDQSKILLKQNQQLENLASDFVYALSLEQGEVGALSSLVDLTRTIEESTLEIKPLARELGITLVSIRPEEKNSVVAPKEGLRIPVAKGTFSHVYILGNSAWLSDSFKRIMGLILLLVRKGQKIEIDVLSFEGLAQIKITAPDLGISKEQIAQLFEKFNGKLADDPRLSETSGLEGYIAKNLIERMAGNISVEEQKDPPQVTIVISFGEHQAEPNPI
ncbi:hypothetical protein A2165_00930 [Candidatus Curtissbacteria bacterium RBG_13_40_7]|uniref:PAS domain-containing protein n=1 Tax=Candidatus Curtissbacteria bacterium RBG_13_40_7 TaxID=1797706 RepID=A0A1F5FTM5_9BACT|nr:MAG: hypothetical protein A2165_00930 [Candidatus Curtissbacteria bacterium RBG_13_40_7]